MIRAHRAEPHWGHSFVVVMMIPPLGIENHVLSCLLLPDDLFGPLLSSAHLSSSRDGQKSWLLHESAKDMLKTRGIAVRQVHELNPGCTLLVSEDPTVGDSSGRPDWVLSKDEFEVEALVDGEVEMRLDLHPAQSQIQGQGQELFVAVSI